MRRALWIAIGGLLLSLAFALAGRAGMPGGALLSGLFLLAAVGGLLALLPFWDRVRLAPMPGLFLPVRKRDRWCIDCGRPASRNLPCAACGSVPKAARKGRFSKGN